MCWQDPPWVLDGAAILHIALLQCLACCVTGQLAMIAFLADCQTHLDPLEDVPITCSCLSPKDKQTAANQLL